MYFNSNSHVEKREELFINSELTATLRSYLRLEITSSDKLIKPDRTSEEKRGLIYGSRYTTVY